jgi:hypothetical protein
MLAALDGGQGDYTPCCFMIFTALQDKAADQYEFLSRQLDMGLDALVQLHSRQPKPSWEWYEHRDLLGLPVRYHPDVTVAEGREDLPDGRTLLRKEYRTPVGALGTEIEVSDDWPYGGHVPFLDDFLVPRARKRLIAGPADLDALGYLLQPPNIDDLLVFREEAAREHAFAEEMGLAVTGGWGVGGDMAFWLCGIQEFLLAAVDTPDFAAEVLARIARWNESRMVPMLDAPVDLFVRRAWYESTDFWSPALFERFLLPSLRAEVALAHEAGAKFGYIMTTGSMPLLDLIISAGVDVLIGVDPIQGKGTQMAEMKQRTAGRMALWGGVNGFLTVELGTEEEVRAAVRRATETLGPGGFILSPVDNVTADTPTARGNVAALIDEWRRLR